MIHRYTQEQIDFIKENVQGRSAAELTKIINEHFNLNLNVSQIRACKKNHKLRSGIVHRFNKGHVPANKGIKGVIYEGSKKTWFKKGNIPVNHKPVGSERVSVLGYVEIKVAEPNRWRLKHTVIYEEHHGPIPKGYSVIFGDKDRSNLDINNLILVSRKQLLALNRYKLRQNDVESTKTAIMIADIKLKISEIEKSNQ